MQERPCAGNFSAFLEFDDGTPATISYNGYGYFDTSELTWGIGNRMYGADERIAVRRALLQGGINADDAKEGMRFGANVTDVFSQGSAWDNTSSVGTRAHIRWFGITVASFERGDIRQSPNGIYIYIYDDDGMRELPVEGGRGVGLLEIKEMYEAVIDGKPLVHDGRWALATTEVGEAIMQSGRERREIMLSHQCEIAEDA
jgi:phthalate 4,5-cis-dihydrodiol dehydrogenase